jgi:hypothetical protein
MLPQGRSIATGGNRHRQLETDDTRRHLATPRRGEASPPEIPTVLSALPFLIRKSGLLTDMMPMRIAIFFL